MSPRVATLLLIAMLAVSASAAPRKMAASPTKAMKKAAAAPAVAKKAKAVVVPFAAAPAAVLKKVQPDAVSPEADVQATTEEVAQLAALYDEANIQVEAALSEVSASAPTAARAAASPAVAKAKVRRSKAAASPAAAKPSVSKSVAELEAGIDENVFELQMLAEEVGV